MAWAIVKGFLVILAVAIVAWRYDSYADRRAHERLAAESVQVYEEGENLRADLVEEEAKTVEDTRHWRAQRQREADERIAEINADGEARECPEYCRVENWDIRRSPSRE